MTQPEANVKLINIGRYAQHLPDCASRTQTPAGSCDCGYPQVVKDYAELAAAINAPAAVPPAEVPTDKVVETPPTTDELNPSTADKSI